MPSKSQLASDAITVEQDMIGENVGCQDQAIAAFGGLRRIEFLRNGERHAAPVILSRSRLDELQQHLTLVYTGQSRNASDIASEQVRTVGDRGRELRTMYQMVDEGLAILTRGDDITRFGQLLHESWMLKRSLTSKVSTAGIDDLYEEARRGGAIGGKLLGAGGGGFFLFFVRPEDRAALRQRLDGLVHVPFAFSSTGSEIIYYDGLPGRRGVLYPRAARAGGVRVVKGRIFVAGHRGMVGQALLRRLGGAALTRERAELDLRDPAAVDAFFAAERPSRVVLAAARVGGILANQSFPANLIADNLAIQGARDRGGPAPRRRAAALLRQRLRLPARLRPADGRVSARDRPARAEQPGLRDRQDRRPAALPGRQSAGRPRVRLGHPLHALRSPRRLRPEARTSSRPCCAASTRRGRTGRSRSGAAVARCASSCTSTTWPRPAAT